MERSLYLKRMVTLELRLFAGMGGKLAIDTKHRMNLLQTIYLWKIYYYYVHLLKELPRLKQFASREEETQMM